MASETLEGSPKLYSWYNGMGRIPMDWVGAFLMCDSKGPSMEGLWPRTLRTEVLKHKLSLGLGM